MTFPTKTIFAAALAITGLAATIETSSAMPLGSKVPAASPLLQDVRWGCGPGWHPNPWGRCVPDRRPAYGYGYGYGYHPHYWGHPEYRPYHRWYRY
ncbi:hypothetical protein LMIY3S_01327 [Labrys miyagiensis]